MKPRRTVAIGDRTIGDGHPVAVVAELGVNHLGDYGRMQEMIHAAVEAGADFLKFQTYLAEKRYDPANPKYEAFTENLRRWQFSREQEAELWAYAHKLGARVFTSCFDEDSVAFADGLGTLAYKLAAFEITNLKLVRRVAETGKPVVFSRGMATDEEVDRAIAVLLEHGAAGCVILHTISSYPLAKRDSHLWRIHHLRERYDWPIGHSDHTWGTDIPPLAVAAGASMIEKHFTVHPKSRESDNFFSLTPDDLRELVFKVRQTETFMGRPDVTRVETEAYMWDFRRHSEV